MENTEWVEVTTLGSAYEEQVSMCGKYWRHRPLTMQRLSFLSGDSTCYPDLPWQDGRAPK
jgi:hypothetical protein